MMRSMMTVLMTALVTAAAAADIAHGRGRTPTIQTRDEIVATR